MGGKNCTDSGGSGNICSRAELRRSFALINEFLCAGKTFGTKVHYCPHMSVQSLACLSDLKIRRVTNRSEFFSSRLDPFRVPVTSKSWSVCVKRRMPFG
jgi:hypothetical protein